MGVSIITSLLRRRKLLAHGLFLASVALPCVSLATPPPWAPAHGWRAKNDPSYVGYSGRSWNDDYGIEAGRCNHEAVGAALGAVAGGAVGSAASKDSARLVAIAVGSVIGAAIGAEIGRDMDKADRACVGHALELASAGQSVTWLNSSTGVTYKLTPVDSSHAAEGCRKFRLVATGPFGLSEGRATACPNDQGVWDLAADAKLSRR